MANKKQKLFAFTMSPKVAQLFYELCEKYNVNTPERRTQLLMEMANAGMMDRVVMSDKSEEEYLAELKKNFNVVDRRGGSNEKCKQKNCPYCGEAREDDLQGGSPS